MSFGASFVIPATRDRWRSMYDACAFRDCRNTIFMRSIQSRVGVTIGEQWYCCVDCLVAAMNGRYSALCSTKVLDIRHIPRRSIGLLLLSKGFVTEEKLRTATSESERRGEELEQTLTRAALVSDAQIAIAKAAQWGCPVLGQDQTILQVQAPIPLRLLRECSAVPLHFSRTAKRLVIGFLHRVEHSFLNSVEEIIGVRPEACFVTRSQFAEQCLQLSAPVEWEEVVLDEELSSTQMANTTGRFAIEVGAKTARSTRCQDFIWTRLAGKRRVVDLLYRVRRVRWSISENELDPFEEHASSAG